MPPVVQLVPPLSDVPWSADFVAQSLETLFVCLRADGARHLRPIHASTLRLGWAPGPDPGQIVADASTRYALTPLLIHSTSWRHESDRLILTYAVAVEPPEHLSEYLIEEPVVRSDLARGDALRPPTDVDMNQVIEHAFRHLAWLVNDDAVVSEALADWVSFLARYEPEPFRAFGP